MADKEEIKGQQGLKEENKPSEDVITKEETMFKIGPDGKALPEKYPIDIYDHNLDKELIEESMLLMSSMKKQEAISNVLKEYKEKQTKDIEDLKKKIESEKDEKIKKTLTLRFANMDKVKGMEEVKEKVNSEVILNNVKESREIIQKLKDLKEKQKQRRFIELMPCNSSEAYLAFEEGKTIDDKETGDWVADLISKRCHNPKYTFEVHVCINEQVDDKHIVYTHDTEQNGSVGPLNKMFDKSQGGYIMVLNDDWVVKPNYMNIIDRMEEENYEVSTLYPSGWKNTPGVIPDKTGNPSKYINLPFFVVESSFVRKRLSNYLCSPKLTSGCSDIFLSYYVQHILKIEVTTWPEYGVTPIPAPLLGRHALQQQDMIVYHQLLQKADSTPLEEYERISYV